MSELTQAQLLELVNTRKIAPGNARVRQLTQRIVTDLFKTIDELDVTADEFWAATGWLTRLGATGQTGLITAGLGLTACWTSAPTRLTPRPAAQAARRAPSKARCSWRVPPRPRSKCAWTRVSPRARCS